MATAALRGWIYPIFPNPAAVGAAAHGERDKQQTGGREQMVSRHVAHSGLCNDQQQQPQSLPNADQAKAA
jgi:hypothetical protein